MQAPARETVAVFVSRSAGLEDVSWRSFLLPLSAEVWGCIFGASAVLLVFFFVLETFGDCAGEEGGEEERSPLRWASEGAGNYWSFATAYFGGPLKLSWGGTYRAQQHRRVALFLVSFLGVLVFTAYRSSLTAAMSVRSINMPFETLEELLHSDYK